MKETDDLSFYENLLLTQIYCDQQLLNSEKNIASIFRSINPIRNGKKLFEFKITDYGYTPGTRFSFSTEWTQDPIDWSSGLFIELFNFQLLKKRENIKTTVSDQEFQGKILVAEIGNTVTDGVSEIWSDGLIDFYDYPPIDTWFHLENNPNGRLLFAWIPIEFVYNATEAMTVNCVDCLYWFDEEQTEQKEKEVERRGDNSEKSFYNKIRQFLRKKKE
ncbi:hypothetical protein [Flavobacterium ajazii]|uniref:hypothetical protein n=1 Tax=Flavobacterium ajazii TaxID=2692318 RepID=UPI0013D1633C|nr:hypothetical protein [Flavobacterium ajazii]